MTALMTENAAVDDAEETEWELGSFLLHREDDDHYVLFDPDNRDMQPVAWLAGFGIDTGWTFDQWHIGDVLVTVFTVAG